MIKVKNTVKALIIKNGHILVLQHRNQKGVYYTLPGGRQKVCETLAETLERECFEELGVKVSIDDLWAVHDFAGEKPKKKTKGKGTDRKHVVEFVFSCCVPDTYKNQNGPSPDKGQLSVVWLNLKELPTVVINPVWLEDSLIASGTSSKVYRQQPTALHPNGHSSLSNLNKPKSKRANVKKLA